VLVLAAAGSVLEIGVDVHRLGRLCFSLLGCFCFCLFLCQADPLAEGSLCSGSYGPDEAPQFTSNCSGDLSLILACCSQSHVTLVQPVLCFPRNLFDLF